MKRCVIIGAGDFFGFKHKIQKEDFIIAADGGYDHLKRAGIEPKLLLGDFDSITEDKECGIERIVLPVVKDDTDLGASVAYALERGCRDFRIYGGTGGRFAHTIANIQLLSHIAESGGIGYLYGDGIIMTVLNNGGEMRFLSGAEGYFSAFSLSDRCFGVHMEGLKYELDSAELTNTFSLGVSNEFIGKEALIRVETGLLLLMWEERAEAYRR